MDAFAALLVAGLGMAVLWAVLPYLRPALGRAMRWGCVLGVAALLVGAVVSMAMYPNGNQAPLFGMFVTGPLGFVVGAGAGFLRELLRSEGQSQE